MVELLGRRPRMLALGEPAHGADVLLEARNEVFRRAVEHDGYRTIAIESDCLAGSIVDEYVTGGPGDLDAVLRDGFSHGFGASAANRELVRWMRAYNEGNPEPVRFAGFDGPVEFEGAASPRRALTALAAAAGADTAEMDRLVGPDEDWTEPAAMRDPARSIGRTPAADRLRLLADDWVARLAMRPGADAGLAARTAVGLLRYHRWMADPSPERMGRMLGARASMMAANLLALAERGPLLVFAHNAHLQREQSSMGLETGPVAWWSAGALVAARVDYAFVATAVGTLPAVAAPPPPETLEGLLYAREQDRFLALPSDVAGGERRVSPWFGYAPLDPAHLASIDGILFVRDA